MGKKSTIQLRDKKFAALPAGSLLLIVLFIFAAVVPARASSKMSAGFNRLLDAVVRIDVRELNFEEGARHYTASIGSGMILSEDGLILTNAHVVSPRAVEINVTLASLERVSAKLVGWDHWTDLAVLRLDAAEVKRRGVHYTWARFGDSDQLYLGETVYAVGTPHGLTRTVSRGIISNNRRYFEDNTGVRGYETGAFNTWLQTDAAINPGNSGGPLVTEDGAVIGINSRAYLGADNLAFAIPSNVAQQILNSLVKDGKVTRSYVGIVPGALQDLEDFYALKQTTGLLVESVDPGSPAAHAGLHAGDIVLSVENLKLDARFPEQIPPIQNFIARVPVGSMLHFLVKRGDQTLNLAITTEKLESRQGEEWVFEKWGLSVQKVSRAYARLHQFPDNVGLLVTGVEAGYPASVAGITRDDVITKIDQVPIDSLDVAKKEYAAFVAKSESMLVEARKNRRVTLHVLKP